jgi:hypothetical protein
MHVDKSKVETLVRNIENLFDRSTIKELEESNRQAARLAEIIAAGTIGDHLDEVKSFNLALNSAMRDLDGYRTTLAADLMQVKTRYLVTDRELVSPAGFHPSDRVFIQTKIAIHTDTLNMKFPNTGDTLHAYDIDKLAAGGGEARS